MSTIGRLLPVSQNLLGKTVLPFRKNLGESARSCHAVCGPPRSRQSFAEKVMFGVLISLAMWAGPFYILYRIPDYQQEERNTYTGK